MKTITSIIAAQPELGTSEKITIAMAALSVIAVLLIIYLASAFLLTLVRLFLKKSLIAKGVSQDLIMQLLARENNQKSLALKWCCLFSAAGLGLLLTYFFQPIGWHSVIILTFSLAAGFLVWYLLLR
ncbi:hypothetical protein EDD80_103203 [Anseongella ginsenosidimutans]|uniref:Uncharacterized protein n=1 Tax=Anseongella ginsenosidimutans TaxID=496056 RepID=A0A4R3KVE6_9SPHI|nr:hypothetical protein [Anseongella ginsenosidimutans]QEC53448.1 hypothetical protein FRZ59_14620 [Anseongella ginsenosidimutans]TCS88339.1 hypothetical protein EDD80_103203 [Anseongella ginsenosidimutans]